MKSPGMMITFMATDVAVDALISDFVGVTEEEIVTRNLF